MTMAAFQISIRQGKSDDLTKLQNLFVETITIICNKDYNQDQIRVWTSSIENNERWHNILTNQYLLIAENQNQIIGFCSLDNGCYVDLLYVHKDYQRQGIAYRLYADIEKEAQRQGQNQLTTEASITARPFFEKVGFKETGEQTVVRQGIELTNFKMTKKLTS